MVLNGDFILNLPHNFLWVKETVQTLIRRRILRFWVYTVCKCPSPGFTDNPLYTGKWSWRLFHLTLNFLYFKQTVQSQIRRSKTRRLFRVCTVCKCLSPGFTDNPFTRLSDVTVTNIARLQIIVTCLGKRELILVLFVCLFDLCLFGFIGFLFLLGSGKGCGLWLWHSLDFSLTFFFSSVFRTNARFEFTGQW